MDVNEIIAALSFRFGNRNWPEGTVLRELRFAQQRLEEDPTVEYWFLATFGDLFVEAGAPEIVYPESFLRLLDCYLPSLVINGEYFPLRRVTLNQAEKAFGNSTGRPQVFVMVDGLFRVFPSPDTQYNLHLGYVRKDTILDPSTNPNNQWTENATQVLLNKTGIALAQGVRDKEALANFTNDFQVSFAELQTRVIQREEAGFSYQRGEYD